MGLQPSRNTVLLGLIVLIGSFLRVFRIGSESLWLDEGYSVHFVETMSFAALAFELPWTDNSPPLYYLVLDVWTAAFGYSESTIRLLSALFGIATIVVIYLLGSELYSKDVGLLSAGLLSVSSFHVWYAQDARTYTLLALLASLSFLFLLRSRDDEAGIARTVPYVVSTVALVYTHTFGLFVVLAQWTFVFGEEVLSEGRTDWADLLDWVKIQTVVGVLVLPYLRVLLVRVVSDGGEVWVQIPPVAYVVTTPLSYFSTSWVLEWNPMVYFGLLAFVGALGAVAVLPRTSATTRDREPSRDASTADGRSTPERPALLLVPWVVIPIAVPALVTYAFTPIYVQRYTIPASIGLFILVARGLSRLPRPSARLVAVVLVLSVSLYPLPTMYADDQKEQWRESAQYVEENADSDDLVVLSRGDLSYPFGYYFDSGQVPVTTASESTLREEQRTRIAESETVWLVLSHINGAQAEEMRESLDQTHRIAEEEEYKDIRVVKFVRE